MLTKHIFPSTLSLMEFIMFSESYDDSPVVGSSINKTDDSFVNSNPTFKRFRSPPDSNY